MEKLSDLSPEARDDINRINIELVHQLKANDAAFSLGKSPDSMACSRFGLITQDTDMEELIGLVYATGKEIEESSKVGSLARQTLPVAVSEVSTYMYLSHSTSL